MQFVEKEFDEYEDGAPTVDSHDAMVELTAYTYEDALKPLGTFIISGPLPGGKYPGRAMASWSAALAAAIDTYGGHAKVSDGRAITPGIVGIVRPTQIGHRWAIRVATMESIARAKS